MDIHENILDIINDDFINSDILESRKEWMIYKYDKLCVPRVSNIISSYNKDIEPLLKWSNRLGFNHINYQASINDSILKGNITHDILNQYFTTGKLPEYSNMNYNYRIIKAVKNTIDGFLEFWNKYRYKDLISTISTEKTIVTPYYGGTYDLLITLKNGNSILYDFKTTNRLKNDQFLQLSAYKYALEKYYNITICSIGILLLNKYKPECKEYILNIDNDINNEYIEQCTNAFFSRLYSFYYNTKSNETFDNIFMV